MIAVVKVAGQQFKVEKDQTLYVPHMEGKAGDKIDLEVILADKDGKLSVGSDIKTKVKAAGGDRERGVDAVHDVRDQWLDERPSLLRHLREDRGAEVADARELVEP